MSFRPVRGTSTSPSEFVAMGDRETDPVTIPLATPTSEGTIDASDKAKLDALDPIALAAADAAAEQLANKNVAGGYPGLDLTSGRVAMSQIASGSYSGTEFVKGDGTLATPPGLGGGGNVTGSGLPPAANSVPVVTSPTSTTAISPTPVTIDQTTGDMAGVRDLAARDVAARNLNPTGTVKGRDPAADGPALDAVVAGLAAELVARAAADAANVAAISAEGTARAAGDAANAAAVVAEAAARAAAIAAEAATRAANDASLQSQITAHVGVGGSQHPAATTAVAGFLSAADKARVDTIDTLREILSAAGVDAPDDIDLGECIWAVSGRWQAGRSTEGFAQAHFYCENAGSFGDGGTCELYCPIGPPNADAASNNWPTAQDDLYQLSYEWDEGIHGDANTFVDAAMLTIYLFGFLKTVGGVPFFVTLDPDGDVRIKEDGNEVALFKQTQLVLGAESGVRVGTPATVSNDSGDMLFTYTDHGLGDDELIWPTNARSKLYGEPVMPDLVDGQIVFVVVVDDDHFKVSRVPSSDPSFPDIVAWNPVGGESAEYLITHAPGAGSLHRMRFGYELETAIDALTPFVWICRGFADGRGALDEEDGAIWKTELHKVPVGEQIGPWSFKTCRENSGTTWRQSLNRTSPGTAIASSPEQPTAAPLVRARSNFDGAGNHCYAKTMHDFGGNWGEIQLLADIGNTSTLPLKSFMDDYRVATGTLLKVGGVALAEVMEYRKAQRVLRVRWFDADHRIRGGDTVTWELHRRVGGSISATVHQTGTFVAGAVSNGPHAFNIGVRVAIGGPQDGSTVVDVRGGVAVLHRHRSR